MTYRICWVDPTSGKTQRGTLQLDYEDAQAKLATLSITTPHIAHWLEEC